MAVTYTKLTYADGKICGPEFQARNKEWSWSIPWRKMYASENANAHAYYHLYVREKLLDS